MRYRAGLGDRDHPAAPDGPGQRNRSRRATVCRADPVQRGIAHQGATVAAKWRIGHDWQIVLRAPRQQVAFNATIAEAVTNLVGRAATAAWNIKELLHLPDVEVGNAPRADLSRNQKAFESRDKPSKLRVRNRPVQQI